MSIEQQIVGILAGIDQDEINEGYWQTSSGIKFGEQVLAEVRAVAQLADDNYKLKREKIRELKKRNRYLESIIRNYQLDIRNSKEHCGVDLVELGFCQGTIYLTALDTDEDAESQEPIEVYICPQCLYAFPASGLQKTIAEFERAIEEWWEDERHEESSSGRNKYDTDDDLPKFVKLAGCTL